LLRHGEAAASWDQHRDPGLSVLGHQQAQDASALLQAQFSDRHRAEGFKIISSPLARAQETAAPLAKHLSGSPTIEARVAELPSPANLSLKDRGPWLHATLKGTWSETSPEIQQWREAIISTLLSQKHHCAIFTHFVVINAVVSYLQKRDKVLSFLPDNASCTHLRLSQGELCLLSLGAEDKTVIN